MHFVSTKLIKLAECFVNNFLPSPSSYAAKGRYLTKDKKILPNLPQNIFFYYEAKSYKSTINILKEINTLLILIRILKFHCTRFIFSNQKIIVQRYIRKHPGTLQKCITYYTTNY